MKGYTPHFVHSSSIAGPDEDHALPVAMERAGDDRIQRQDHVHGDGRVRAWRRILGDDLLRQPALPSALDAAAAYGGIQSR